MAYSTQKSNSNSTPFVGKSYFTYLNGVKKSDPELLRSAVTRRLESGEGSGKYKCPSCGGTNLTFSADGPAATCWNKCRKFGDAIEVAKHMGEGVAKEIAIELGFQDDTPKKPARRKSAYNSFEDALASCEKNSRSVVAYEYGPANYVLRINTGKIKTNGKEDKKALPLTLHPDGKWRLDEAGHPWPLFMTREPVPGHDTIVICEGEKAASAIARCNSTFVGVTSRGGSGRAASWDWSKLPAGDVVVFPDNDPDGTKYAQAVAGLIGRPCRILDVTSLPDTGDAADLLEGLDGLKADDKLREFIAANAKPYEAAADAPTAQSGNAVQPIDHRELVIRDYSFVHAPHDTIMEKVEPHLAKAGIYRRGGKLVRVRLTIDNRQLKRMTKKVRLEGPRIDPYDKPAKLGLDLTRYVVFAQWTKGKAKKLVPVSADSIDMAHLLNFSDWPTTPILEGITSGPFLRSNGTICDQNGYDAESGWYLDYSGEPLNVPDNPTPEEVRNSVDTLLDLVSQFEWTVPEGHKGSVTPSQAGWLGYLLTLLARPAIDGPVPAFVFNATTKGSGKTMLSVVANTIHNGFKPSLTEMPQGKGGDEEVRKMMFSFAVAGSQSVLIDNWPSGGRVGGTTLDYYTTSTSVVNRVLGLTKPETAPWRAVLSIGGNALSVTSDFADRCVWMSLTPTVAVPRDRVPEGGWKYPELDRHVLENREKYLRCAMIILRSHFVNKLPKPAGTRNWGTFDEWARIVRDCVKNVTGIDLRSNLDASEVEDAESSEMSTLIAGLSVFQENFGPDRWWGIGDLQESVNEATVTENTSTYQILHSVMDFGEKPRAFNRVCGGLMSRYAGRICDGLKIAKRTNSHTKSFQYRLERASTASLPPQSGSLGEDDDTRC